jgi:hypothetical protein
MIKWTTFKEGDVVTFYFHRPFTQNICFQFKTFDDYYVYGKRGEKHERYILAKAVEVGVIR